MMAIFLHGKNRENPLSGFQEKVVSQIDRRMDIRNQFHMTPLAKLGVKKHESMEQIF